MESGKALARAGEALIEVTSTPEWDCYGGALSAAGAQVRNAGDALAQVGASCRFKTGLELVTDELREAATCLQQASDQLTRAVQEARMDENEEDDKENYNNDKETGNNGKNDSKRMSPADKIGRLYSETEGEGGRRAEYDYVSTVVMVL